MGNLTSDSVGETVPGDALEQVFSQMASFADAEYVRGCHLSRREACLGWEAKAARGAYGKDEYEAHKQLNEAMGAHFGIYRAIKEARAAIAKATP